MSLDRVINLSLLFIVATIWASAFGAMKIAVMETGPLTVAAARTTIAAMVLIIFLRLRGPFPWQIIKDHKFEFLVIGSVGTALPFTLLPWAEQSIDSSLAGLLMSVGPFATLAGAYLFRLEDHFPKSRLYGIGLGLIGVCWLLSDGFVTMGTANLFGQILAISAAIGYVSSNLMVRKISHIHWLTISTTGVIIAAIFLWPLAVIIEMPTPQSWSFLSWQMLLWLGIMPTAVAFSIRYLLIARAGPTLISYVGYLIPAIAMVIGALFLNETITTSKIGALLIILAGLVLAERKAPNGS